MPDVTGGLNGTGIGTLRWLVTLYRRDQEPGPESAISERWVRIGDVHADIQPTYPSTFYGSVQVDTPITHLIRMRWADYLSNIHVIARTTRRPDIARYFRTEVFRVRRAKEIAGRKRFVELECELEQHQLTEGDTDNERSFVFAEHPPTGPQPPTVWDDFDEPTLWDYGETEWPL